MDRREFLQLLATSPIVAMLAKQAASKRASRLVVMGGRSSGKNAIRVVTFEAAEDIEKGAFVGLDSEGRIIPAENRFIGLALEGSESGGMPPILLDFEPLSQS